MNFCYNCGNKINENDSYCSHCGLKLGNVDNNYSSKNVSVDDKGGFGWGVLGYFIPLVGLILFLSWKDKKPRTAKAAGKGALISVVFVVTIFFIIFVTILNFSFNRIIDYDHTYDDYDYNYDYEYNFD